jgi:lauroyl/myristoyl acyltransferase
VRGRLAYVAYRSAAAVARTLPEPAAAVAAGLVGAVMRRAAPGRRALVARHLQRVHGWSLGERETAAAVRAAFASYARYWMELFRLPGASRARIEAGFTHEGYDMLLDALAAGRGVVVAVPHLGNWDWGGAWFAAQGHRLTAVAEVLEPRELFDWFVAQRQALGIRIVPLGPQAGTELVRALRAGEVVTLVCDRDIGGGGVEVEFFGERTRLPAGPATLALRTGAPLLPVAVYLTPGGGHHGVVLPAVPAERTGAFRDDVVRVTQAVARALEDLIRRAPEQWHLFQPNWPSDPRP